MANIIMGCSVIVLYYVMSLIPFFHSWLCTIDNNIHELWLDSLQKKHYFDILYDRMTEKIYRNLP